MPDLVVVSHPFPDDHAYPPRARVAGSLPALGSSIQLGHEVTHFTRDQHLPRGFGEVVILLPVIWVNRRHAVIRREGHRFVLEDLQSTNGVALNGCRLHPLTREPLRDGDEIEITGFRLVFRDGLEPS
jgi:hypothetical protein